MIGETQSVKFLRDKMDKALQRASEESAKWSERKAQLQKQYPGEADLRIQCKVDLPLNDAFKACTFWQQEAIMWSAALAAEVGYQMYRQQSRGYVVRP